MTVFPLAIHVYIETGASTEEVRYIQSLLEGSPDISEVLFIDSQQFREHAIKVMARIEENFTIRRSPPRSVPVTPKDAGNGSDMFRCLVEDYSAAFRVTQLISPDIPGLAGIFLIPNEYPYSWDDS